MVRREIIRYTLGLYRGSIGIMEKRWKLLWCLGLAFWLYWENGKENGNYKGVSGIHRVYIRSIGVMLGILVRRE